MQKNLYDLVFDKNRYMQYNVDMFTTLLLASELTIKVIGGLVGLVLGIVLLFLIIRKASKN